MTQRVDVTHAHIAQGFSSHLKVFVAWPDGAFIGRNLNHISSTSQCLPHLFPEVKKVDAGSKSVGACEAREIISFVSGQKQLECGGGTGLE